MHITNHIVAVAAVAGFVAANPVVAPTKPKLTFSVQQKPAGKKLKTLPAKAVLNTYQKFGKSAPSAVKSAAATGTVTSTVSNNPEAYDEAYLSPVTVGGVTMNLNFDTGSSDLWVYSDLLPSSMQTGHNIYKTSTGSQMQGYSWKITYGDGSGAAGLVYADHVVVGQATATKQAVEAATSVSSSFVSDTSTDGLLGLAFSTINTVEPLPQNTFFDTIKSSLAAPLFTSRLRHGAAGSYDFGYIDSSKYTGAITYVPVNSANGWWQFSVTTYTVGKVRYQTLVGSAIADTGTTLSYLPPKVCQNYYGQVSKATYNSKLGGWVFPCSATLPALQLNIGGVFFSIPGSNLNYSPVSSTLCFGGLQPNTNIGFSILGDTFLKSVFTVWDMTGGTPRLGFATPT